MTTRTLPAVPLVMPCTECGRRAKWVWLGNNYTPPQLVCGIHKRQYLRCLPIPKEWQ